MSNENDGRCRRAGDREFLARLDAARGGDESALEYLMGECRNYLLLIANDDMDQGVQAKFGASDFVQQTMLAACQNIGQFRGQTAEEFRGWLRTILHRDIGRARRQFYDAAGRDVGRERRLDDSQVNVPALADPGHTPGTDAALREQAMMLGEAMKRLPENYRQVIQYRDWGEMSFPEIGRQMNISEEAARKLWNRAITRLEELLEPLLGESTGSGRSSREKKDEQGKRSPGFADLPAADPED
jgi:RNA polymerase sigma-70 factor, ECF subfamily